MSAKKALEYIQGGKLEELKVLFESDSTLLSTISEVLIIEHFYIV